VPLIPFVDVESNTGGVVPAHIGGIEANVGMNIGFDKTIPIERFVVEPLYTNEKFEYSPAFRPDIITCPETLAVNDNGPTATPSSV
jgi:hypothetical protein